MPDIPFAQPVASRRSHSATVAMAAAAVVCAATAMATFLMLVLLTILTTDALRGYAVG